VDAETWTIDPAAVERKITPRTKGIIVVHLFGHPADMDAIGATARRHGLFVLEDAAQAHGAEYRGRRTGGLADVATFSFFGNKIVTTGEGGMVTTGDDALAGRMRLLRTHGMDPTRRYWHPVIGYNYRMTNVAAAIGLAQLERIQSLLARRQEVVAWYREALGPIGVLTSQGVKPWAKHVWWMYSVLVGPETADRDGVMESLRAQGIETRPIVHPLHTLPPYVEGTAGERFPVAERIARTGINLPTGSGLTRAQVDVVCDRLLECLAVAKTA
jgi:perosamine synthetase